MFVAEEDRRLFNYLVSELATLPDRDAQFLDGSQIELE
jgi:hypothetical protein